MLVRARRSDLRKRAVKKREEKQLREWKLPQKAEAPKEQSRIEQHHILPLITAKESIETVVKSEPKQRRVEQLRGSEEKELPQEKAYDRQGYTATKKGLIYRDDAQEGRKEYEKKEDAKQYEQRSGQGGPAKGYEREQRQERAYQSQAEQPKAQATLSAWVESKPERPAEQNYVAKEAKPQPIVAEPEQPRQYGTIDTKFSAAPQNPLAQQPFNFQRYSEKSMQSSSMVQGYMGGTADAQTRAYVDSVKQEIGFKSMDCCREKLEARLAERLYERATKGE